MRKKKQIKKKECNFWPDCTMGGGCDCSTGAKWAKWFKKVWPKYLKMHKTKLK